MNSDSWYYDSTTGPVGPFAREQIEALIGAATLSSGTLVRHSDADPWIPATEAFELAPEPSMAHGAVTGEVASLNLAETRRSDSDVAPLETGEWPDEESESEFETAPESQDFASFLTKHRVLVASVLASLVAVSVWFTFFRGPDECVAVFRGDFPPGNVFYGQILAAESEEGYVRLARASQAGEDAFAAYIVGPGKEVGHRVLIYPAGTRAVVERVSFYDRLSDPSGSKIRILEVRIEEGADEGRLVWLLRDVVDVLGCDYI